MIVLAKELLAVAGLAAVAGGVSVAALKGVLGASVEAKAKHQFTPNAPYFSDTQRKQIVETMNELGKTKIGNKGPAQASAASRPTTHVPGGEAVGLREGQTGTGSDKKPYIVKGGVWVPR